MNKDLIKEVESLLKEIKETHRFSMSKIYGLSNKVFNLNEEAQSCSSCLIRKRDELQKWLEAEKLKAEKENTKEELSRLKAQYNELPVEDRESDIGANMLSEIQRLTDESKQSRKVGNYDNQPKKKLNKL